jgi:cyclophilin family peptidyl-prolyl cis-trans isomerase/HEAT repeat protein
VPRRLILFAALTACTPSTSSTAPTSAPRAPPPIHDLEVQRESATAALLERSLRGPDVLLAIRALGRIADPIALSHLNVVLDAPATRAAAARALGSATLLGADNPEAESALLAAWQTTADPTDRIALAEALGRLGTTASLPTLTAALHGGPAELREPAAIALGVLTRRGTPFDDPARAALVALTDVSDSTLQYAVAYALAHEHEPTDRGPTDAATIRLTAARSPETRAVAVMGLTRRKVDPQRARPLFHTALDDRDFRVRTAAVRGLLALADDAATLRLLGWARKSLTAPHAIHPTLELLDHLSRSKLPQKPGETPAWLTHVDLLVRDAESLISDPPTAARIACHGRAVLARAANTRPPFTCPGQPAHLATVLSAESLPDDQLVPLLHAPDPRIRAAAAAAMLAHHSAAPILLDLLADPSPAVVGTLADALTGKDPPAVTDALRAALAARALTELTREAELYTSLTASIAAIKAPVEPCTAGLTHPNFAVRAAARTCVTTLTGADPGPQLPTQSPPRPPHAPSPGPRLHWRLTTNRGVVDIDLDPAAAPWHVAALAANTRAGFYDGLTFHRVVPGFVVQGGDPEGTGWGGPGYTLPSEPTTARFTRGAVGIADAGKDTGGCQFFIMHARAPHLEGRFTWVGEVTRGLDVVDALLVSDTILRAELIP